MNKTGKIVIAVVVVGLLAGVLVMAMKNNKDTSTNNNDTTNSTPSDNNTGQESETTPTNEQQGAVTMTYTDDGFSPSSVTVKSGGQIKFVNNSSSEIKPSSNPHPVHTDNPELNSGDIEAGGSQTLTLTTKGTWGIHNHYNSVKKATVVVE